MSRGVQALQLRVRLVSLRRVRHGPRRQFLDVRPVRRRSRTPCPSRPTSARSSAGKHLYIGGPAFGGVAP
eukprot:7535903-Lingulodinium_polyedra.AAC.1